MVPLALESVRWYAFLFSAKDIQKRFNCVDIHASAVIESAVLEGTPAGFKAKEFVDSGKTVPEDIISECILERLSQADCKKNGWVLHGYPTTRAQATTLQTAAAKFVFKFLIAIQFFSVAVAGGGGHICLYFVVLSAPIAAVRERAQQWCLDSGSGDFYNLDWISPPEWVMQEKIQYGSWEDDMSHYNKNYSKVVSSFRANTRTIDAAQPYSTVRDCALDFLRIKARSNAPIIPRVIVLGTPGSGKTTVSKAFAEIYNAIYVNVDDIAMTAVASNSKIGNALKPYMKRNMMLPDALLTTLVTNRLWEDDCVTQGWVLDGFPMTRAQAEGLQHAGFLPRLVAILKTSHQVSIERLSMRCIDPLTGDHYHLTRNPPLTEAIKNRLQHHPSDKEDAINRRIQDAEAFLPEIRDFYKQ
eukprot:gene7261-9701_t